MPPRSDIPFCVVSGSHAGDAGSGAEVDAETSSRWSLVEPPLQPLVLALAEPRVQVSLLARAPPPAPNPSRPCPEGDPISFRLCREEGLVFRTRSTHQPQ